VRSSRIVLFYISLSISTLGFSQERSSKVAGDEFMTGGFPCPAIVGAQIMNSMNSGYWWGFWNKVGGEKDKDTPNNQCFEERPELKIKNFPAFDGNVDKRWMQRAQTQFSDSTELVSFFEKKKPFSFYNGENSSNTSYSPYKMTDSSTTRANCFIQYERFGYFSNFRSAEANTKFKELNTEEHFRKLMITNTYRYKSKLEGSCILNIEVGARQGRLLGKAMNQELNCEQLHPLLTACINRCEEIKKECLADSNTGFEDEVSKNIDGLVARSPIVRDIRALEKKYTVVVSQKHGSTRMLPMSSDDAIKYQEPNDKLKLIKATMPIDANLESMAGLYKEGNDRAWYEDYKPNRDFIEKQIRRSAESAYHQSKKRFIEINWGMGVLGVDAAALGPRRDAEIFSKFNNLMASLPPAAPVDLETDKTFENEGDNAWLKSETPKNTRARWGKAS
jgi:hypothetical protein